MEKHKKNPFLQKSLKEPLNKSLIDLYGFIESISKYSYILIKTQTPYMARGFPRNYPIGKDLDIITMNKDFNSIIRKTLYLTKKYPQFNIKTIRKENNYRLRFEFENQLHYQIDISQKFQNIPLDIIKDSIKTRIKKKSYYIPNIRYEIMYRIYDYYYHQTKRHHLNFILENSRFLDLALVKDKKVKEYTKKLIIRNTREKSITYYFLLLRYKINKRLNGIFKKYPILIINYQKILENLRGRRTRKKNSQKERVKRKIINIGLKFDDLYNDCILKMETAKLVAKQLNGSYYNRLDVIVRYFAIENFYGRNNYGFSLYNKMQKERNPNKENVNWIQKFVDLMENIEENGFHPAKFIKIDQNHQLIDGSHRLACALYYNERDIPIKVYPINFKIDYGKRWFTLNGFDSKEIEIILRKKKEIFKDLGIYFILILWPPIEEFFDEIQKRIKQNFYIIESTDYLLNNNFNKVVKNIYKIDDIDDWKVEKKLEAMTDSSRKIRSIYVEILNPKFRKKKKTNYDISTVAEEIKRRYRSFYAKKIENYYFDIIMHMSENYWQSRCLNEILKNLNK